jgi:hypothetical protein
MPNDRLLPTAHSPRSALAPVLVNCHGSPTAPKSQVAVLSFAIFGTYGWQTGAYLVAVTTFAYIGHIVAVSVAAPGQRAPASR